MLASRAQVDVTTLPYHQSVLSLIDEARAQGRPVYLATASNERFAQAVSAHLGRFDGLFASDVNHNLAASNKAKVLIDRFGDKGFDYVATIGMTWKSGVMPIVAMRSVSTPDRRAR